MEQLNIVGKRSGEGFVAHREKLVKALSMAQAPKVRIIDIELGRKGFLNYLRALGGSNIVKVTPNGGPDKSGQATVKGLKVVCGANTSRLDYGAWVSEDMAYSDCCEIRVSPNYSVTPNLGASELAEALSRVIPFTAGKKDDRPVLKCIRFAQSEGKLTLSGADGYRLAEVALDFEDGEGEALIPADEIKGLVSALKKAHRVRLGFDESGLVVETEAIRYHWRSENGNYPDTEQLFPTEHIAVAHFDTREMAKASASLSALQADKSQAIIVRLGEGSLTLTAKDEVGSAELEAETEGQAETAISGAYLLSALKALGGMVEMKVNTPQAPILFTVDGYRLVVMPMLAGLGKKDGEGKAEAVEQAVEEAQPEAVEEAEAVAVAEIEETHKSKGKRKTKEPVAVE